MYTLTNAHSCTFTRIRTYLLPCTVVIVDPGLHNQTGYAPWDQGLEADIFLKDSKGNIFIGRVWPGTTAFPDFLHPKAADFWEEQVSKQGSEQCVQEAWGGEGGLVWMKSMLSNAEFLNGG